MQLKNAVFKFEFQLSRNIETYHGPKPICF